MCVCVCTQAYLHTYFTEDCDRRQISLLFHTMLHLKV